MFLRMYPSTTIGTNYRAPSPPNLISSFKKTEENFKRMKEEGDAKIAEVIKAHKREEIGGGYRGVRSTWLFF
jgi:hypothetical protein